MEPLSVRINGLNVCYLHRVAVPASASVIFIHGFPFGKEIWQEQLNALPQGTGGIAYDIRGFGGSEAGHRFFSIDRFAADLMDFVKALSLSKVILCGISMGGYIALRAYERAPETFAGLVLCDTNASADSNEAKLNRFAAIEQIQRGGKQEYADAFAEKIFCRETLAYKQDTVGFIKKMISGLPEATLCASQLALASRTDTTAVLGRINVPALIIRGQEDQLMTEEQALFLKSSIAGSELAQIPGSGHLPNLENPEAFNRVLNDFLKENYGGGTRGTRAPAEE